MAATMAGSGAAYSEESGGRSGSIGEMFSFSWYSAMYSYTVITDKEDSSADKVLAPRPAKASADATPSAGATQERRALLPFVIISLSYLLYTFTDGSVRMIVLLAAYNKGFTAMEVAVMFTLYETAGVVTNLLAGLAGARWGLKTTHCSGLILQLVGLGMLCGWKVVPTHARRHAHTYLHAVICYAPACAWHRLCVCVCHFSLACALYDM
jgi:hypothetical protein